MYTREEIAKQERLTGLRFAGYLQVDGFSLVPVFLRSDRSKEDCYERIMFLNGRISKKNGKV